MSSTLTPVPASDPDVPRAALDAFGYACLTVAELDGRCLWRTALARSLMAEYFVGGHFERGYLPPELLLWMHREVLRRRVGAMAQDLTVLAQRPNPYNPTQATPVTAFGEQAKRLSFRLHGADTDSLGEGQWLIVMSQ